MSHAVIQQAAMLDGPPPRVATQLCSHGLESPPWRPRMPGCGLESSATYEKRSRRPVPRKTEMHPKCCVNSCERSQINVRVADSQACLPRLESAGPAPLELREAEHDRAS